MVGPSKCFQMPRCIRNVGIWGGCKRFANIHLSHPIPRSSLQRPCKFGSFFLGNIIGYLRSGGTNFQLPSSRSHFSLKDVSKIAGWCSPTTSSGFGGSTFGPKSLFSG